MTRPEILDAAKKCVCGGREQDYGNPEDNFEVIGKLWDAYFGFRDVFTPGDVSMMLALLKVARIKAGRGTEDSFVDLAGYAACGGELATRGERMKPVMNAPDADGIKGIRATSAFDPLTW